MFLILNYRATIAQDRPARRTLCHAFIGQFEISKIPLFADDLIKIALPRSPFSSETGVLEKSCGDRTSPRQNPGFLSPRSPFSSETGVLEKSCGDRPSSRQNPGFLRQRSPFPPETGVLEKSCGDRPSSRQNPGFLRQRSPFFPTEPRFLKAAIAQC
jgi:hypothetical protein